MARWQKLLARMRASERCVGFTYADAAAVLYGLGFELVSAGGGGSHRRWTRLLDSGQRVIIGLVDTGHGTMKPVYIKAMLAALEAADLLPGEG